MNNYQVLNKANSSVFSSLLRSDIELQYEPEYLDKIVRKLNIVKNVINNEYIRKNYKEKERIIPIED